MSDISGVKSVIVFGKREQKRHCCLMQPLVKIFSGAAMALGGGAMVGATQLWFQGYPAWLFWGGVSIFGAGLIWAIIGGAERRREMSTDKRRIGDINLNMGNSNQVGHIGHVINEAPQPDIELIGKTKSQENRDGTYSSTFQFEVIAPYPPRQLYLKVSSSGISEMDVAPATAGAAGVIMVGHTGRRDGFCFTTLMQPFGRYTVNIRSREPSVHVEYEFN